MKLKSYVNVNNIVNNIYIIIYIYKLKIILFNFMDKIYKVYYILKSNK